MRTRGLRTEVEFAPGEEGLFEPLADQRAAVAARAEAQRLAEVGPSAHGHHDVVFVGIDFEEEGRLAPDIVVDEADAEGLLDVRERQRLCIRRPQEGPEQQREKKAASAHTAHLAHQRTH